MGEIFVTAMTNMFPQTGHFALAVGGSSNFFEYAVSISPRLFEGLKMTIAMTVCSWYTIDGTGDIHLLRSECGAEYANYFIYSVHHRTDAELRCIPV